MLCRNESERKVVSDMVAKGATFKEIEACVNDSQVTIRMQDEMIPEDSEETTPCDCQDPHPKPRSDTLDRNAAKSGKSHTITIDSINTDSQDPNKNIEKGDENPNVYRLKVQKHSRKGDKYDLEVNFKIPRPWSEETRNMIKNMHNPKPKLDESHHHKTEHSKHGKAKKKAEKKGKNKKK